MARRRQRSWASSPNPNPNPNPDPNPNLNPNPNPSEAAAIESNRSAAHAKLGQFHAALEDADAAVARRPEWGKAHGRRGAALHGLREWARSEAAYLEGLTHEPDSAQLQQGLEEARKAAPAAP